MPTLMPRTILYPKSVMGAIPRPYSQEDVEDPLCRVKFFDAAGAATWWVVEYDPETRTCFGFADLGDPSCAELGYFSLDELEASARMFERDLWFQPTLLSEIIKKVKGD